MVVVLLPSPNGVGVILENEKNSLLECGWKFVFLERGNLPSHDDVFAIWLVLQALQCFQRNLGFLAAILAHFGGVQADLLCQHRNVFWFLATSDLNVTVAIKI